MTAPALATQPETFDPERWLAEADRLGYDVYLFPSGDGGWSFVTRLPKVLPHDFVWPEANELRLAEHMKATGRYGPRAWRDKLEHLPVQDRRALVWEWCHRAA